jgi:hypothetical protein
MGEKANYSILRDPIAKFFRGNNFAFFGTLNKDGSPQVTPTWIDIVEDEGGKALGSLTHLMKNGELYYLCVLQEIVLLSKGHRSYICIPPPVQRGNRKQTYHIIRWTFYLPFL